MNMRKYVLITNIFLFNFYAQAVKSQSLEQLQRISVSIDFETIISENVYINFLYEKEYKKRLSFLYGVEYQKNSSSIKINGQVISLYEHNFYYLKSKMHYYFLSFNEQQNKLNGLYTGLSLKIGGGNRNNGFYKVIDLSPGILIGTCIAISNRVNFNIELDVDGYFEWIKETNSMNGFKYQGKMTSYPNIWFTIGYRL